MTRLAPLLAPIGLGERIGIARIPALLAAMQAFRRSIDSLPIDTDWDAEAVALITRTAEITLACLTGALTEARDLADNLPILIGAWLTDPAAITARMNRAAWLADGWATLCSFWTMAVAHDGQPPGLADLVHLLPIIPDEVAHWPGFEAGTILPRASRPRAPARRAHRDHADRRHPAQREPRGAGGMNSLRSLHLLQANVTGASDAQIAQIVALVDSLPQRGIADDLIAPLRRRLARLRPHRPMSFMRLLFTPLDPLIVPAPIWRRGSLSVPRTALAPIVAAVRGHLNPEAAQTDTEGRQGPLSPQRMAELAVAIWPRAAMALDSIPVPSDWIEATGLPENDYHAIAATVSAVLAVAVEIETQVLTGGVPQEDAIRTIMGRTAPRGGPAVSAVVVVLLARLSAPGVIIAAGTEAAGSNPSKAVDHAIEHTLDRLQMALDADQAIAGPLAQATQDCNHIADLLEYLDIGAATRPERQRRVERLRRATDLMCRERFETALRDEFTVSLERLPRDPADDAIEALEAEARGLRQLALSGRRLSHPDHYDALLQGCLQPIRQAAGKLRVADQVRLAEILLGAREAMTLLQ